MNIQETFVTIEAAKNQISGFKKEIEKMEMLIKKISLDLLKDQHGLEVGSQCSTKKGIFQLTKIEPCLYKKHIDYTLIGNPTKKDGEFSKRGQFIGYLNIEKEGRI